MKNKLIALLTMSALAVGTLAGCGNTAATDTAASARIQHANTIIKFICHAAAYPRKISALFTRGVLCFCCTIYMNGKRKFRVYGKIYRIG